LGLILFFYALPDHAFLKASSWWVLHTLDRRDRFLIGTSYPHQ
jgi:hypothetical protein